jgi:hypothetical protein
MSLLRHTVASLAYRSSKALRGAPPEFAEFDGAGRKPIQILAHMGDLFDWALSMANGKEAWRDRTPMAWDAEVARYFAALEAFDQRLASGEPLPVSEERLFQGPIADALTHTGQLAMMRRLAGCPISGENYFRSEIAVGRVGIAQAAAVKEF